MKVLVGSENPVKVEAT